MGLLEIIQAIIQFILSLFNTPKGIVTVGGATVVAYLIFLAAIPGVSISISPNIVQCAGNEIEPCISYFNITNLNSTIFYNGGSITFDKNITDFKIQQLINNSWSDVSFPPSQLPVGTYQYRIIVYKNIGDTVEWNINVANAHVDPTFLGYNASSFFTNLNSSTADLTQGTAIFQVRNPTSFNFTVDLTKFYLSYHRYFGNDISSYSFYRLDSYDINQNVTDYGTLCVNSTLTNGSIVSNCSQVASGWHWDNSTNQVWTQIASQTFSPFTTYNFKVVANWNFSNNVSIEWFPNLNLSSTVFTQNQWAWFNSSKPNKRAQTICPNVALSNFPFPVNNSNGLQISSEPTQVIWSNDTVPSGCNVDDYFYYNSSNIADYQMVNGSENAALNFEVERGNGTSHNPTSVWDKWSVGVFHIGEGYGTNTVNSTDGKNATLSGAAWNSTACAFGYCLRFVKNGDNLNLGNIVSEKITNNITVETWVNLDGYTNSVPIARQDDGTNRDWVMYVDSSKHLNFLIWNSVGSLVACAGTSVIPLGSEQYLAGVYDGTNIQLYWNGTQEGSNCTQSGNVNTAGVTINVGYYSGTGVSMQGTVDEVRISLTPRSPAWINQTYQTAVGTNKNILGSQSSQPATPQVLLNGLSTDQKYEFNTTANITVQGSMGGDSSISLWIDNLLAKTFSSLPGYFNYTVPNRRVTTYSNGSTSLVVGVNANVTLGGTIRRNLTEASFNISGNSVSNYANWSVCNQDLSWCGYFDGSLNGNINNVTWFSNSLKTEQQSFGAASSFIRYINYTVPFNFDNSTQFNNATIDLNGKTSNSASLDFIENFNNNTFINSTQTNGTTPYWIYDDFSYNNNGTYCKNGDTSCGVIGRWGFSQVYSNDGSEYQVNANSNIYLLVPVTADSNVHKASLWTNDINITDYGQIAFTVAESDSSYGAPCGGINVPEFGIRDITGGSNTVLMTGPGISGNFVLNLTGTTENVYKNNVLLSSFSVTSGHKYGIYITASSAGNGVFYGRCDMEIKNPINISGFRGFYSGSMVYLGGNIGGNITSLNIANFSSALVSATLKATCNGNCTGVSYYLSPDNGVHYESVTNNQYYTFVNSGNNISYRITVPDDSSMKGGLFNESNGIFIAYPTISKAEVTVSTGYPSWAAITLGSNPTPDWNYSQTLNASVSPQTFQISSNEIGGYISSNCIGQTSCLVPLTFAIGSSGTLNYTNINASETINRLEVNTTQINTYVQTNSNFNVTFKSASGNATVTPWNVSFPDDWTISIKANSSSNATGDSRNINAKYSAFNYTYALNTAFPYITFYPSSGTQTNVTPYGQNTSVPILNITSDSNSDPFNLSFNWETNLNSCLNFTISNTSAWSNLYLWNTSRYFIKDNINYSTGTGTTNFGLWDFLNLSSCAGRFYPPAFDFHTICQTCVRTFEWSTVFDNG